jgi:hypothetical protein
MVLRSSKRNVTEITFEMEARLTFSGCSLPVSHQNLNHIEST